MYVIMIWQCLLQSPVKKHERIMMKSLLSEAEKKEILDEATVKTSAAHVLNLMETVHFSYEEAVSALKFLQNFRKRYWKKSGDSRKDL